MRKIIQFRVKSSGSGKDDWVYDARHSVNDLSLPSPMAQSSNVSLFNAGSTSGARCESKIGFATGGAKDINNFRENIEKGYLPFPTDVTYEGIFYDYYFDTGMNESCSDLFCPSYSCAVSNDPFSKNSEYYLSVGLNSGIKEKDFSRKKLNLVVVLDISGSMSSSFDQYYYDRFGKCITPENNENSGKSKLDIACRSITALLDHLKNHDKFGMVMFDDQAYLGKPLSSVGDLDMKKLKEHILSLSTGGGTQLSAGLQMATRLFNESRSTNPDEYENRIIFLTDAMPNIGETSEQGLLAMTKDNSNNHRIYTTFIGIGVDFNTELTEYITKIRGANYYSVHSAAEFKERLDDEFDFMVTPLVFNLELTLRANGYEIEKVFGSPEANESTGEIMKVNTLFPSKSESGETKGGLVLLKLKKKTPDASLRLHVSYEDRAGKAYSSDRDVIFDRSSGEYYDNTGIRKGIVLVRYANLLKNWIIYERNYLDKGVITMPQLERDGLIYPDHLPCLGKWEHQSTSLRISPKFREFFTKFADYFENETKETGDQSLEKELLLLEKLVNL
jgi:Ca-activated chloride channel family protein